MSRESADRDRGTLTFRVPADRFDAALSGPWKALGRHRRRELLDTQDIGREYMDLETRLARQAATPRRDCASCSGARTARLSDVLAAEKELSRVIEEREAMEGERRY